MAEQDKVPRPPAAGRLKAAALRFNLAAMLHRRPDTAPRAGRLLFGSLLSAEFAAEESLCKHWQFLVRELSGFVEFHLRFYGFAAAALALLCNVTLIVGHSDPLFRVR
ncbi:MAG TPA: hypothetical protein VMB47_01080 [Candidatus Aquilonibacter sp.]|nr:hypothetical protein [Candidatus Aquilonibacter sp.]